MTNLQRRRGFDVVPVDVGPATRTLPDIPLSRDVYVVRSQSPTALSFDVALGGVLEDLEEVRAPGNEVVSLEEIRRVLRPGGYFPIYQLPQRYSSREAIERHLRRGYFHPRRLTAGEITELPRHTGYRVERLTRSNLLRKIGIGVPVGIRDLYGRLGRLLIAFDGMLCSIPGLDELAGVLQVVARVA